MNAYHQELIDLQPYLLSYAIAKLKLQEADAEDMVQDTLVSALENSHDQDKAGLKTWLITILRNKTNDFRRKDKGIEFVPLHELRDDDPALADYTQDPELKVIEKEAIQMVKDVLETMPVAQREAYWMKVCDGYSLEEISTKLNISEKTVDNLINRAKKQILKEVPNPYR